MTVAVAALRGGARARPATALLAALLAGLVLWPLGPAPLAAAAVACGALAASPQQAAALLAALVLAAGLGAARSAALDRSALGRSAGHVVTVRAPLLDAPRATATGWRATIAVGGERVLLRRRGVPPSLPVGRTILAKGVLRQPGPRDGWMRPRHLHAILEASLVRHTGVGRAGVAGAIDRVRTRAAAALTARLPAPEGALLRGMVLGDDAGLSVAERDRLRAAGLGHLVAASGANVALLAALVLLACRLAGAGLRTRLAIVLGVVAVYVPLAGAGPSIQRAAVMGGAMVAATLAGRPARRLHALLLAAVATLALDPAATRDPAWQLSFAAVAAIAVLAAPVAAALRRRRVPELLADGAALTIAATLGTAPVSAAAFGTVSLAGLPANVLVAPLVGPITWTGMCGALVAQVSRPAGAAIAWVAGAPLAAVLAIGRAAAALPAAQVHVSSAVALVGAIAAGGLIAWEPLRRRAPVLVAVLVLAACAAVVLRRPGVPPPPPPGVLRMAFLDVGQGDATLVQSGSHALLVDSGPPDGPVLARLRALGVRRLDVLAGTHAQADHVGGADRVLRALPVGAVLDGRDGVREPQGDELARAASATGAPLVPAVAGQRLTIGAATAQVLSPPPRDGPPQPGADPNQRAIVLLVRGGGVRLLLTADAESDVLAPLQVGGVDVLKVSHHGSADDGLPRLLAGLRPRVAVIEVGAHNTYGHPTPQTLADLGRAGVTTLRTDRDGTVVIDAERGRLHVHRRA